MTQGVSAVEGCRARTQCGKKGDRCEYGEQTCVLHFTIGSQTPPNNTRHIMGLISNLRGLGLERAARASSINTQQTRHRERGWRRVGLSVRLVGFILCNCGGCPRPPQGCSVCVALNMLARGRASPRAIVLLVVCKKQQDTHTTLRTHASVH